MGGRHLTPGQAVVALDEASQIIRQAWDVSTRGGVRVNGTLVPSQRGRTGAGTAPAHDIPIWVGAYKPKMLELTGCTADGWLPSLGYLPGGPADLAEANKRIDDAALAAGREPGHIRRLINIGGQFSTISRGSFSGPPEQWAEELAELTLDHGITGFILAADDADSIELFATEVAPATRQLVAEERRLRGTRRSDQVE